MSIKYYRLKKYEAFKDKTLEELKVIHQLVELGQIDLKKEKMCPDRTGTPKPKSIKEKPIKAPEQDCTIIKETGTKRFYIEAQKSLIVRGLIERNKDDVSWLRQLYTASNITAKELGYLLDIPEGSLRYYFRRYGMKKIPSQALFVIDSVNSLIKFMEMPKHELIRPNSNETEEEFRERYNLEMQRMFLEVKRLSRDPLRNEDELKSMKVAITTLKTCMEMEMESKKIMGVTDEKKLELKEKELKKNEQKETNVIDFNGNLMAQTLFLIIQQSLANSGKLDSSEIDELLIDVTKSFKENGGVQEY